MDKVWLRRPRLRVSAVSRRQKRKNNPARRPVNSQARTPALLCQRPWVVLGLPVSLVEPFRDRSGIGRNLAIEVLEYFDRIKFTRRVGDAHVIWGQTPN